MSRRRLALLTQRLQRCTVRLSTCFIHNTAVSVGSQDTKKSDDLDSQANIGSILETIVGGSGGDSSSVAEKKLSNAWRVVFEGELVFEPKADLPLSEWLNYVNASPARMKVQNASLGSKEIIEILDAERDISLDGITRNLSTLNIVHILTCLKTSISAFKFYQWVKKSTFYIPDKFIFSVIMERLIVPADWDSWGSIQVVMNDMIKEKFAVDNKQLGKLLSVVEADEPKCALRMQVYVTWLLKLISLGFEPWFSTYEKVMRICNKLEMYDSTMSVFMAIPSNKFYWAFRLAFSACRSTNNLTLAEELFKEMKSNNMKLDAKCCNDLLSLYANHGHAEKARGILEEMKESGVSMDLRPYTCVIHAYGKVGGVKAAEDIFRSIELKLDPGIYRAMASCYRNAGCFNELLSLLRRENGLLIGATCFALAFEACVEKCEWLIALEIMKDMEKWGMLPSPRLYPLILLACSKVNDFSACKVVDFNMREMEKLSVEDVERITRVYASLGKLPCILKALDLIDERGGSPHMVDLYEYCIVELSKTSLADAMVIYDKMQSIGYVPSSDVFTTLIDEHIRVEGY
ncbi:hypothetical protein KP509_07G068500 [Ceratopteris richardii]|uniref:Pentatricopeptide repeat-containing protein n=1 Tax=Ceratopteris richardii TaxID=49495 RepID=A0A8T2UFI9_CERRI|nr:hypothetical protein KP509_07G068500 [Ceratopteris richardii]